MLFAQRVPDAVTNQKHRSRSSRLLTAGILGCGYVVRTTVGCVSDVVKTGLSCPKRT